MTTSAAHHRAAPPSRIDWVRANLFNTKGNAALTLGAVAGGAGVLAFVWWFVFLYANWGLVAINRKLFFVGSYPADETWRIWVSLFMAAALASMTLGLLARKLRPYYMTVVVFAVIILTLGLGTEVTIEERAFSETIVSDGQTTTISGVERVLVREGGWAPGWLYDVSLGLAIPFGSTWVLMTLLFATLLAGPSAGQWLTRWRRSPVLTQAFGAAWVLLIPAIVLLQLGVSTTQWESAFLDMLVFSVGGFFSFFIGLALALGRASPYWAIRISSVSYIEVVRAAPLLVWLLFATFLKDELGPAGEAFSSIDLVYRVMFVFAFFGGAYIAEVIRGGLASVSRGQHEAAAAMGLSSTQKYVLIILPQAIRAVIPAIIGRFIALWKDTALLAAISLVNTLDKAKKALGGQTDISEGHFFEIYVLVGLIYWAVSYTLSRLGRAAESQLNENNR